MAAEIVEVAKSVLAYLEVEYANKYIVKRAWHVNTLWQEFGRESEHDAEQVRIFVVPVEAPRAELIRGYEEVRPTLSIAVCRKTDVLQYQDELVDLAVEITKDQRRRAYTLESELIAKVTTAELIPASPQLLEKGVMASLVRIVTRMEVAHG